MNKDEFYGLVAKDLAKEASGRELELLQKYCRQEEYNKMHNWLTYVWEADLPVLREEFNVSAGLKCLRTKIRKANRNSRKQFWQRIKVVFSALFLLLVMLFKLLILGKKEGDEW